MFPTRLDRTAFLAGVRAALPVLLAIVPFALITGVAMVTNGIPPLEAMGMSLLVFAGTSMIAAAQLVASGTPALLLVATTAIINLRFLMYSASLRPHLAREPLGWRILAGYILADNLYAMSYARFSERPDEPGKLEFYLGAGILLWIAWQVAVLAGVLIGAGVPAAWRLEFAAPLAFLAMTIPLLRDRAMAGAALAAGVTVIAGQGLPLRLSVLAAALTGIAAGLILETKTRKAR